MDRDISALEAQIQEKLRDSFLASAQERLDFSENAFELFMTERGEDALDAMSRAIHDLKGMGDSFGFPSITMIALRVEEVLKTAPPAEPEPVQGLRRCFDLMNDILAQGRDPGIEATAEQLG